MFYGKVRITPVEETGATGSIGVQEGGLVRFKEVLMLV